MVVWLVGRSFNERLENQLKEAAQVVSDEIVNSERVRLEIERVVGSTIGVAEAIIDRDTDSLSELIQPVIANAQRIDSIIIVDTQAKELIRFHRQGTGPNVFVETTPNSGLDLSGWPVLREVLADPDGGKSVQLVRDPETNELIIYTIGPVRTNEGTIGAALIGTYLSKELGNLRNLALAQITLFDENGAVLASTFPLDHEQLSAAFSFFDSQRYREVLQNDKVTLLDQTTISEQGADGDVNISDRGYRLAYAPFRLRGQVYGIYAVALPTAFVTDAIGQSRNLLVIIFSAGVLTVFLIGYVVSRRISQPILQLVKTAEEISAGNLDQRTGLNRSDEIGILASTFDKMTAQLQHLLKVQEEEASKLNAILNSIADGVVVQDMQGNIVIMNPAAEQILAVMEHNYLRRSLQAVGEMEPVELLQTGGQGGSSLLGYLSGFAFKETHRFEAGQKMFSALSAPVVSADNSELGAVVVLRDITREYESEKLKDDFITSMSHELRTPLTAIKGYNDLLRLTGAGQLEARQIEFIDTIGSNVDDLLEIIQQMLDLSQIDAGNLGIDREPVDLTELIQDEAATWEEKMNERDMVFVTNLPAEVIWVEGDHVRLTRVMHNLIKNAHNYTLPGGRVAVNVSHANGAVQVDVEDTGVGISVTNQRFLFTRFFRAIHEEHTFEISGAGLGLYTSKAIVEAHGGKMWMESELNHGSTFSFSLATIAVPTANGDDLFN